MPTPKKRRSTARKRKGSVVVRSKAKIVKKGERKAKNDTLPNAPAKVYPENAVHFKVKIRKK